MVDGQDNVNLAGLAVADGVGDTFLDDAVERNRDVVWQVVEGFIEQ